MSAVTERMKKDIERLSGLSMTLQDTELGGTQIRLNGKLCGLAHDENALDFTLFSMRTLARMMKESE